MIVTGAGQVQLDEAPTGTGIEAGGETAGGAGRELAPIGLFPVELETGTDAGGGATGDE